VKEEEPRERERVCVFRSEQIHDHITHSKPAWLSPAEQKTSCQMSVLWFRQCCFYLIISHIRSMLLSFALFHKQKRTSHTHTHLEGRMIHRI